MESSFQHSVTDFDLNFLDNIPQKHPNPSKALRKSSIAYLKTKLLLTDSIIHKYNSARDLLDQTQKTLLNSQEECKNICIDYRNSLEKCSKLENDIDILQKANKNIVQQCSDIESKYEALQCHVNQLQVLVTNYEKQIAVLKSKKKNYPYRSQKGAKIFESTVEKKVSDIKNENQLYLSHLCVLTQVISNKRKINKTIRVLLDKYENLSKENDIHTSDYDDSESENEIDEFDDVPDTLYLEDSSEPNNIQKLSNADNFKSDNINDCKTTDEVMTEIPVLKRDVRTNSVINCAHSVDTGRGSSLALSDGEKSFHSPDYYVNDSPFGNQSVHGHDIVKSVKDVSTSPIFFNRSIGTSPIPFDSKLHIITKDRALSPIQVMISSQSTANRTTRVKDIGVNTISPICNVKEAIVNDMEIDKQQLQNDAPPEKICLEANNSKNSYYDTQNDLEIEMILDKMKLNHQIITPIPFTPCNIKKSQRMHSTSISSNADEETLGKITLKKIDELYKMIYSINQCITKPDISHNKNDKENEHNNNSKIASKPVLKKCYSEWNEDTGLDNESQPSADYYSDLETTNSEKVQNTNVVDETENSNDFALSNSYCNEETDNMDQGTQNEENSDCDDPIRLVIPEQLKNGYDNNNETYEHTQQNETDSIEVVPNNTSSEANDEATHKFIEYSKNLKVDLPNETNNNSDEELSKQTPKFGCTIQHPRRGRKLTKLEKMRHKLVPKCKIKRQSKLVRKIRIIPKAIVHHKIKSLITSKLAYEKAVKVMAEYRRKQAELREKPFRKIPKVILKDCMKSEKKRDKNTDINSILPDIVYKIPEAKDIPKPELSKDLKLIYNVADNKEVQEPKRRLRHTSINSTETPKRVLRSRQHSTVSQNSFNCDTLDNSPVKKGRVSNQKSPEIYKSNKRKRRLSTHTGSDAESNPPNSDSKSPPAKRIQITDDRFDDDQPLSKRVLQNSLGPSDTEIVCNPDILNNQAQVTSEKDTKCVAQPDTTNSKSKISYSSIADIGKKMYEVHSEPHSDKKLHSHDSLIMDDRHPDKVLVPDEHVHPKDSILCALIDKYGVQVVSYYSKKISVASVNKVCNLIVEEIAKINELRSPENKDAMNSLVKELKNLSLIDFIAGFKKYLQDPDRKAELYNVVVSPPAPPMTKSEQVLLYVIAELRYNWEGTDLVEEILSNMQYVLFSLNRTPAFGIIESMSHFYAVLCRYYRMKSRLRLFILDAMYCIQFKSVPLIKQCLDVWMHILPLAHMGIAKTPLVTCLIYLLHFYKCEDKYNRVNEIRVILKRKYFYKITEWTETAILEMFSTSIKELRDNKLERKMLRTALIILAKRYGPRWCQNHLIKKMLLPMIDDPNLKSGVKEFCVSMLGPLVKPYPIDMKVHCEIIYNKLFDMLELKQSKGMREAIISSVVCMSKDDTRLIKYLLQCGRYRVSPELETLLVDYVKSKPIKKWKYLISNITLL